MIINSNIKIVGQQIIFVPYNDYHVPKYHRWMESEELQKLTASEPLSLEDEYLMQKSWRQDKDKCTFIILEKQKYGESGNEIESMVGDTNIFIVDNDNEVGEIEIMIAEESARGKKLGWEGVILMLLYGINEIKLKTFEAKILLTNSISINMFNKLGFEEKSRSEVFQEITLIKHVDNEWIHWLNNQTKYELKAHTKYWLFHFFNCQIQIVYCQSVTKLVHSKNCFM